MSLTSDATPSQLVRKPPRQSPRNVTVFVLLAFLAVITLFYAEVIFFGHTLVPVQIGRSVLPSGPYGFPGAVQPEKFRQDVGASTWKIVPGASKVGDAIASHHFPLWNEHEGFGFPLLADMQSGALDPLRLLVDLSNTTVAWDIYYIARSFLGLAAAYAFGRLVKLDAAPSFAFSVAYVFSGHFMIYGNNHWVEIYFLLPVILIGTELVVLGRTRAGVAVTAVSVALSILGGMPEVTLFVFLLAAPYGLFRILSVTREATDQRFGVTRLGQLVLAWLIGLALAAPLILTFLEYTRVSFTAHEGWQRLGLQAAPLADLVLLWVPEWRGMSVVSLLDGSTYAGASVVLLALVSLYPARTRLHRQLTAFFAIAAGLLLAKIYGAPIISAIGLLPGLNVTFIPKWSAPVASFCIAFLAGLGIQRLLTDGAPSKTRTRALAILLALTVVGILLNWNTLLRPPIARAAFGLGIFLVFAFVSWHVLGLGKRFAATGVALLCCQLVVLELFAYGPHNTYQKRFDLLAEPPFATFLRQQEAGQPSRIFALDGILYPNLATTYGMSDIRALDALYPERYLDYIRNFVSPDVIDRFSGDPDGSTEGPARIVGNPWFDLTGVRYVVTTPEDTSLSHCPPVSCQYRGIYTGEVQVFENTHVLPRAFLVGRVKVVDGPQAAIAAMKQESVDPRDLAIVETLPGNAPGDVLPGGGNAEITEYASSNVTIAVDASAPSLLVLTDTYYPGWKATVDGREAPIFATDLAFRGVRVPAGHHLVAFSYDPVTFRLGLAVGFVGLVALLLFAAWPRITRQHH